MTILLALVVVLWQVYSVTTSIVVVEVVNSARHFEQRNLRWRIACRVTGCQDTCRSCYLFKLLRHNYLVIFVNIHLCPLIFHPQHFSHFRPFYLIAPFIQLAHYIPYLCVNTFVMILYELLCYTLLQNCHMSSFLWFTGNLLDYFLQPVQPTKDSTYFGHTPLKLFFTVFKLRFNWLDIILDLS